MLHTQVFIQNCIKSVFAFVSADVFLFKPSEHVTHTYEVLLQDHNNRLPPHLQSPESLQCHPPGLLPQR